MGFIEFISSSVAAYPYMWGMFVGAVAFCLYMAWEERDGRY